MPNTTLLNSEIEKLQYSGGDQAGDVIFSTRTPQGLLKRWKVVGAGTAMLRGRVGQFDRTADKFRVPTAAPDATSNYEVVWEPVGDNDEHVVTWNVPGDFVNLIAGGAIEPYAYVKLAADGTGRVVAHVTGTDAENLIIGQYEGKPRIGELGDGNKVITTAAADDLVSIKWGRGR